MGAGGDLNVLDDLTVPAGPGGDAPGPAGRSLPTDAHRPDQTSPPTNQRCCDDRRTLRAWKAQALAYFDTQGVSNSGTEAINQIIEKARFPHDQSGESAPAHFIAR